MVQDGSRAVKACQRLKLDGGRRRQPYAICKFVQYPHARNVHRAFRSQRRRRLYCQPAPGRRRGFRERRGERAQSHQLRRLGRNAAHRHQRSGSGSFHDERRKARRSHDGGQTFPRLEGFQGRYLAGQRLRRQRKSADRRRNAHRAVGGPRYPYAQAQQRRRGRRFHRCRRLVSQRKQYRRAAPRRILVRGLV